MQYGKLVNNYHLYALSNLLTAFGGGMILGQGISIINSSYLQGDSILAFFVGSVLGLGFLQFFPRGWIRAIPAIFSILTAFSAFILLTLFKLYNINGKLSDIPALLFFGVLCIRFAFWFYSRVSRASISAGQNQQIAWVELGYFTGMILGLIIWKFLGIALTIEAIFILDILLQLMAGLIDLFIIVKNRKNSTTQLNQQHNIHTTTVDSKKQNSKQFWIWRLASAIVFFTIGIQVIIFSLAHQVSEWFSSYIIAFYYIGVSTAAIFCKKYHIQLDWNKSPNNKLGYATLYSNTNKFQWNLLLLSILSSLSVAIIIVDISYFKWDLLIKSFQNSKIAILLFFIATSAFFYEIIALSLLDKISSEEKILNKNNMVTRTYGLMAIAAAISLWVIGIAHLSFIGLICILVFCLFFINIAILKKNSDDLVSF